MRRAVALIPLLLLFAAPAQAATVSVDNGALRVAAGPGETNAVDIGPGLVVADAGAPVTLGPGCMPQGLEALCAGATRIQADLGDGDDALTVTAPLPADLKGGEGNDTLTVVAAVATLDGGDGDDTLTAATGANVLSGGPGFDTLSGGEGDDRVDGGTGGDAADGGGGADSIVLRDRVADTATCGAGRDTVRAEVLDQLDFACERVDYGPPGNAGRLRPITGGGRFVRIPGQPGRAWTGASCRTCFT